MRPDDKRIYAMFSDTWYLRRPVKCATA